MTWLICAHQNMFKTLVVFSTNGSKVLNFDRNDPKFSDR